MRRITLVAVGLVALAVGLVIYLPARIVAGWVEAAVPTLHIRGVTGTALHGHAASLLYGDLPLQGIEWRAHPAALLLGRAAANISVDTDAGQLTADLWRSLFGGDLHASDVHGGMSIAWLARRGGYTFVPVAGRLQIDLTTLELSAKGVLAKAAGSLEAQSLSWQLLNPPAPLGSATADLHSKDGKTIVAITDSHGALALKGNANLNPTGHYRLNLQLRPRTKADPRLKKLMTELGHTDAEGWYRIRENGRL